MDKESDLFKELVLRSRVLECCNACRHYTIRLDDDYCTKHEAWIFGCVCKKKKRYLARFGLSEQDLDWDISFLNTTETENKYDFT